MLAVLGAFAVECAEFAVLAVFAVLHVCSVCGVHIVFKFRAQTPFRKGSGRETNSTCGVCGVCGVGIVPECAELSVL